MRKIKILWIASSVPCKEIPHAGGKTFYYYFNCLKKDPSIEIKLIGCSDQLSRECIENELNSIDHKVVYKEKFNLRKMQNISSKINPFHKYCGLISNYYASNILCFIDEYKKKKYEPDVIILEWTNIVLLIDEIKKRYPNAHFIASEHDVSFVGAKRQSEYYHGIKGLIKKIEYFNLRKRELAALKKCDLIFPHNKDNIDLLDREGISMSKCQWEIPYYQNMENLKRITQNNDVLFYGAMGRKENYLSVEWFIDNVMPLLKDYNIRFVILGNNPPDYIKNMESDKIHITGFVDNIEPYFSHSMCLVAPLVLGAGIKVKILEALSAGIPVLTNNIGIEGIPATRNEEYIHCETPEEYRDAIINIFSKKIDLLQLEKNEREFIKKYSPRESANQYIESIKRMVNSK